MSIELKPDSESLALPGVETVDIEVREPTARITLNAVSTTFAAVTIDEGAQRAEVSLDTTAETATFTFAQPIGVGTHRLRIDFTARINKFGPRSVLSSIIRPTTASKRMLSSHARARRTRGASFRAGTSRRSRRALS